MKRIFLASIIALLAISGGIGGAAPDPKTQTFMKPVDVVLAAMSQHDGRALAGAYAPGVVIVDDQEPYHWSGNNAPADWLSAVTTFGKLHYARFSALADPMELLFGPDTAYVVVLGKLNGLGSKSGSQHYASMTFSLRKIGGDWKITSQSWTNLPAVDLSRH
jgi:ketosteroid isomerase-like protein